MTEKEKAYSLVNNFYQPLGHLGCSANGAVMWNHCKGYADIIVDEIIEALTDYGTHQSMELQNMDRTFNYWQQVKNEIENI